MEDFDRCVLIGDTCTSSCDAVGPPAELDAATACSRFGRCRRRLGLRVRGARLAEEVPADGECIGTRMCLVVELDQTNLWLIDWISRRFGRNNVVALQVHIEEGRDTNGKHLLGWRRWDAI